MAFTPGPNNVMLTASGANFGMARTTPHMVGVVIGYAVLLRAAGGGLGALIVAFPAIQMALKIVGAAYMLWLAWKVANAGKADDESGSDAQPLTFLQAAAFQWINPKGLDHRASARWRSTCTRKARCATSRSCWWCSRWRRSAPPSPGPASAWRSARCSERAPRPRIFNVVMALLLVASIVPMVL